MTAQHFMQNPGDSPVDISAHVLLPDIGRDGFQLQTAAESGSVGGSTIEFDDPDGTFYPIGLNAYRVYETDSEADDPLLFSGGFQARREKRGPYRTEGARKVEATIEDGNAGLSRFVVRADEDGDRPEETETERMTWLFTTSGMALHWDFSTSILDLGSAVMPATDYTDMTLQQVLDDMAQQTSKNYYVWWDGSVGNPPDALLVYAPDSGDHLSSDLRFSNVEADADGITTFYAGLDWELNIDPARIASYVSVRYANGRVDQTDTATADEFSRIDRVMDGAYIKTATAAQNRAIKYLQELDSEENMVSGTVFLPSSKASQFRAGMRCEMKSTHLTGMSEFVWVRLVNVTVTQISEDPTLMYALAFEGTFDVSLQPCDEDPTPSGEYPPLGGVVTDDAAVVYYVHAGLVYPTEPTPGYSGAWHFPVFNGTGGADFAGSCVGNQLLLMVVGDGEMSVAVSPNPFGAGVVHGTWEVIHASEEGPVIDDSGEWIANDSPIVIPVSTHGGTECIHHIYISDDQEVCGSNWGFLGATWTAEE